MLGSFGINIDVPKQEVSELTMEVILLYYHVIEVSPKLLLLLRFDTSSLACGDYLGSIFIISEWTMEVILSNDPKIEVSSKLLCYWDLTFLVWHVGIVQDQYSCSKTGYLKIDHGGQTPKWSWNWGQSKTSFLLRLDTSSLAGWDHLGSIFMCQNRRSQN